MNIEKEDKLWRETLMAEIAVRYKFTAINVYTTHNVANFIIDRVQRHYRSGKFLLDSYGEVIMTEVEVGVVVTPNTRGLTVSVDRHMGMDIYLASPRSTSIIQDGQVYRQTHDHHLSKN